MRFNYHLPVNLIFGRGRVAEVGGITAQYAQKAMLVTGSGSVKRSGLRERVVSYLNAAGVEVVIFDKAAQNPLTTTAIEGAELCKAEGCRAVVGLGGGSMMDCAKGIAFLCANEGDINDYIFNRRTGETALPLILIPTTCGTGSEGNGFAVLTNPENGDKKSLRCGAIVAKASIIDSELMETMPPAVLASVGFDALCHCMEAYTANQAQPLTDSLSLSGMDLIGRHLVKTYQGRGTPEDWDALSWASTIGGMVINTAGVTLAHGMEHPASGLKNIVHGRGLAALTPVITEWSYEGRPEKFAHISRLLGGTDAADCAEAIRRLLDALDLRVTLSQLGIVEEDIPWMTENLFKVSVGNVENHPVSLTREKISALYQAALG